MDCPLCGSPTRVLESRSADAGAAVRRRRSCAGCGERFTSFERIESPGLNVVKRDGTHQRFDRAKLLGGLVRASHKRDVDPRDLEAIVAGVAREAHAGGGEIGTERIGELCLDGLESLDRGAFLQFAGTLPNVDTGAPRNARKKHAREGHVPSEAGRMLNGPTKRRARGVS